jgi:hypothetical protein
VSEKKTAICTICSNKIPALDIQASISSAVKNGRQSAPTNKPVVLVPLYIYLFSSIDFCFFQLGSNMEIQLVAKRIRRGFGCFFLKQSSKHY